MPTKDTSTYKRIYAYTCIWTAVHMQWIFLNLLIPGDLYYKICKFTPLLFFSEYS